MSGEHHQLVIVLGAGASLPYGFPLGGELVERVLKPNGEVDRWIGRIGFGEVRQEEFRNALLRAQPGSIDEFLEQRPDYVDIGKAFIAAHLLCCESEEELFRRTRQGAWYSYFFNITRQNAALESLWQHITILTYNYDRSLEHWITNKFRYFCNLSSEESCKRTKQLRIIHIHGQLGHLPGLGEPVVPFGTRDDPWLLRKAIEEIRIVHEDVDKDAVFNAAHQALNDASHVVFLGFGYLPRNVARLKLDACCANRKQRWQDPELMSKLGYPETATFHGTAVGYTPAERTMQVSEQFSEFGKIVLADPNQGTLEFLRNQPELFRCNARR